LYDRIYIPLEDYIGNLIARSCPHFILFIFISLSLLFPKPVSAEDVFTFSDSSYIYTIHHGTLKKQTIRRYLKKHPDKKKKEAFDYLLDSLGYFLPHTDTLAQDTLAIAVGNQAVIDTIIIACTYTLCIDSIQRIRFPVRYNAGLVQALARQTVTFLAERGFPFAKLSLGIVDSLSSKEGSDTTHLKKLQKHLTIQFNLETGKHCVFDNPLFLGGFKTKEKLLAQDIVFARGQVFDKRKIEISQKRLISRPYIASVHVSSPGILLSSEKSDTLDTLPALQEASDSIRIDSLEFVAVPFHIEDNSGMGIDGALAYSSDANIPWSGILTLTMLNIFHRGESASLFYRGEKLLQQFEIELAKAYPFLWPLFISGAFGLEIEEKNYGYLHGEFTVLTQLKELWQAGLSVNGHETTINDQNASWHFIGIDLLLQRCGEPCRDGMLARDFLIRTGTGIADKATGRYNRWRFDFTAGSHIPLFKRQAFLGKIATHLITSDDKDSLHQTEKIRIGGYKNIRGYADNQFPFIAIGYAQTAYLFYFNPTGSVYIFMDGGVGFSEDISLNRDDRTVLFGYGLGIRVPVKFGVLSLEWARNYREGKGLGRIHVRVRNNVSPGMLQR